MWFIALSVRRLTDSNGLLLVSSIHIHSGFEVFIQITRTVSLIAGRVLLKREGLAYRKGCIS